MNEFFAPAAKYWVPVRRLFPIWRIATRGDGERFWFPDCYGRRELNEEERHNYLKRVEEQRREQDNHAEGALTKARRVWEHPPDGSAVHHPSLEEEELPESELD